MRQLRLGRPFLWFYAQSIPTRIKSGFYDVGCQVKERIVDALYVRHIQGLVILKTFLYGKYDRRKSVFLILADIWILFAILLTVSPALSNPLRNKGLPCGLSPQNAHVWFCLQS